MSPSNVSAARNALQRTLFPGGAPTLWCPPLTHYTVDGRIDRERISKHLQFISSWVKGLLVPGTTGDGWELTAVEKHELTDVVLDAAPRLGQHVLLGALHPETTGMKQLILDGVAMLKERSGTDSTDAALGAASVCGFAVCPPRGKNMSQVAMGAALAEVLDLGLPTALYQLPQFTENEMSPELAADLASRFANFIFFKDTSGGDRVAAAARDYGGVYLTRGMEGDYASWLKLGGGCYDGFLLSTANSFGAQLHAIRELLEQGRHEEAKRLSARLSDGVSGLFRVVDDVDGGNPFANANKLADHYFAHGPRAHEVAPPRLHCGHKLTSDMVQRAGEVLRENDLMPTQGYLA